MFVLLCHYSFETKCRRQHLPLVRALKWFVQCKGTMLLGQVLPGTNFDRRASWQLGLVHFPGHTAAPMYICSIHSSNLPKLWLGMQTCGAAFNLASTKIT
jgi:hypothetical protein